MPEDIKISIITVCLNAEKTVRRTIESVLNQSFLPFEYIIIDGGSTDGTLEIIREYGSKITKLISEKDNGISDAFNKGIQMTTGQAIGILNADDWYEYQTLQIVSESMKNNEILHGAIQYWQGSEKYYQAEGNHNHLESEMTIHHPTVFVKKEVYNEYGYFLNNFRYAMDFELLLRFKLKGKSFVYIPMVLANMSLDGVSDKNWAKAIHESYLAKVKNGISPIASRIYKTKQLIRTFIARYLKKSGFGGILNYYRKNFALIKKTI